MKSNEQVMRIEVIPTYNVNRNSILSEQILENESKRFKIVREGRSYRLFGEIEASEEKLSEIFSDQVVEEVFFDNSEKYLANLNYSYVIERCFKPGVTDNPGRSASDALSLLNIEAEVFSGRLYYIDTKESLKDVLEISKKYLGNELIESITVYTKDEFLQLDRFKDVTIPKVKSLNCSDVNIIKLDITNEELEKLSKDNCLALTLEEMLFIKKYYESIAEDRLSKGFPIWPTDVELEVIAQTWSEHCKHKIFSSEIDYKEGTEVENKIGSQKINSLYKTFVKSSTKEIEKEREIDWLVSVFEDNAGIVRYDENVDLSIKVETHNSPSALDPYGGALTGILGVNRDILGCGLGARPIANTDVFCFADPKLPLLGEEEKLPAGLMNPAQILEGVHLGVEDGGNKSGIPTVNGAMYFDNDYAGKPLVFVGTVGVMPQKLKDGRKIEEKTPQVGDYVIMIGGEVGADGIHGATFSSLELNEDSPVTAVQIGDPLTQKRVLDFLIEARDLGLYSSITDNGAGGLSSSVGEMATMTNGAKIHLDRCPVKYSGLRPYEIMISESQERMTVAVGAKHIDEFMSLAKKRGVLSTNIGEFTQSGSLEVYYQSEKVAELNLEFLHEMLPQMKLDAYWDGPVQRDDWFGCIHKSSIDSELTERTLAEMVSRVISSPNVATKENLVRRYDHEVQGATQIKPFVGKNQDGVNNSGGIWLHPHGGEENNGVMIGCGLNPRLSLYDPYQMAQVAVDEAIRNIVCTGANPDYISLLDNFCWPDPVQSQSNPNGSYRLGQLVRTTKGLYDACKDYGTPLVSGKDSMKNDFRGKNRRGEELKISVLPTLLVTSMGKYDVRKTVTTDFKEVGDSIYLIGNPSLGLGASELTEYYQLDELNTPNIDTEFNANFYRVLHSAISKGLLASCHDISDGGLITTLLESSFGNNLGANINLKDLEAQILETLFSESPGRVLVSISPDKEEEFKKLFTKFYPVKIGETTSRDTIELINWETELSLDIDQMKSLWKGVF
jgi:phosphoribosylformylglycinamidine synthase